MQTTLPAHQRAVSDLSWSLFEPNILATCSADTYINLWDIRFEWMNEFLEKSMNTCDWKRKLSKMKPKLCHWTVQNNKENEQTPTNNRDPKKPVKLKSFCGWTGAATQVKWNRHNPMSLASTHNGEVRIWDIRVCLSNFEKFEMKKRNDRNKKVERIEFLFMEWRKLM